MKGHDTTVYALDEKGDILFVKTFDVKTGGEPERLAAIDCYANVRKHFGNGTITARAYKIISAGEAGWICFEDEKPTIDGQYLIIDDHGEISIEVFDTKENDFDIVTWCQYWMPLPEKP